MWPRKRGSSISWRYCRAAARMRAAFSAVAAACRVSRSPFLRAMSIRSTRWRTSRISRRPSRSWPPIWKRPTRASTVMRTIWPGTESTRLEGLRPTVLRTDKAVCVREDARRAAPPRRVLSVPGLYGLAQEQDNIREQGIVQADAEAVEMRLRQRPFRQQDDSGIVQQFGRGRQVERADALQAAVEDQPVQHRAVEEVSGVGRKSLRALLQHILRRERQHAAGLQDARGFARVRQRVARPAEMLYGRDGVDEIHAGVRHDQPQAVHLQHGQAVA